MPKTHTRGISAHLIALLLPFTANTSEAREIFVSSTGSNATGNGSQALPYQTLQFVLAPANGIVAAGDVITLRGASTPVTYNASEFRLRVRLTLRAFAGEKVRLLCPINTADPACIFIDPEASGSVLQDLEIEGGSIYTVFLQTAWEQAANPTGIGASNIRIENCKLHGSGRDVVKVTPKSNNLTIVNSEIFNSGKSYPPGTPVDDKNAEGIDNVNGDGMIVRDSYIHDAATTCLYFKGGARNVLIERNRIERCGVGGIMVGFDTSPEFFDLTVNPGYYEAIAGTVRNNIIRSTDFAGIGLYASRDSVVANNTLIDTARVGHAGLYFGVTLQDFDPIAGRPANLNPVIRNNIVQNSQPCVAIRFANELGGLSGLSGNPGTNHNYYSRTAGACAFRDGRPGSTAANVNLTQWRSALNVDAQSVEAPLSLAADGKLLATSAARDIGVSLAQVTDDIDRETRTAPIDIGADEFNADAGFRDGFE